MYELVSGWVGWLIGGLLLGVAGNLLTDAVKRGWAKTSKTRAANVVDKYASSYLELNNSMDNGTLIYRFIWKGFSFISSFFAYQIWWLLFISPEKFIFARFDVLFTIYGILFSPLAIIILITNIYIGYITVYNLLTTKNIYRFAINPIEYRNKTLDKIKRIAPDFDETLLPLPKELHTKVG